MILTSARFSEFFAALYDGATPYAWQHELLDELMTTGRWPETLDIPTGGGKSSVIDIHLFANALAQQRHETGEPETPAAARIPRRLSTVVPRRSVVDSHLVRATEVLRRLNEADSGILTDVRELLIRRSTPLGSPESEAVPLRVYLLRGGTASVDSHGRIGRLREDWVNYPAAVQVLCATPDMLGSRLLFRGYGLTSKARPRSAGLLAFDHVSVIDEAHLSQQLLKTFRRVETMVSRPTSSSTGAPPLQVCASTATQHNGESSSSISLDWENLDSGLEPILLNPKPVEYRSVPFWNQSSAKHGAEAFDAAAALRAESADGTIGVVVNRVATALAVQELAVGAGLQTKLIVGPMRIGASRDLSLENVDLLIATQTIEVGVDLDFTSLVTDLAPGSALAQRAGRVNRRGSRPEGRVIVLGPELEKPIPEKKTLPYTPDDLAVSGTWVLERADDPRGLSPAALREVGVPQSAALRPVFSHLTDADARLFSRTSERLVGEPDLTFWLRDSLENDDQEIRVVGRALPSLNEARNDDQRLEIIRATAELLPSLAFEDTEAYPSTPGALRRILSQGDVLRSHQAWILHDGEWSLIQKETSVQPFIRPLHEVAFRSGDLVLLDEDFPSTLGLSKSGEQGLVLAAEGTRPIGDASDPASTGVHVFLHEVHPAWDRPAEGTRVCHAALNALHNAEGALQPHHLSVVLPDAESFAYRVILGPETEYSDGAPAWVLCVRQEVEAQEQPLSGGAALSPVLLETHQKDVAERVKALSALLAIPSHLRTALADAALHHDDGKDAEEFQMFLRAQGNLAPEGLSGAERSDIRREQQALRFAKSNGLLAPARFDKPVSPRGWRHEMLSAAVWWAASAAQTFDDTLSAREITLWLIGTHHGYGRSGFPIPASQVCLSRDSDPAVVQAAQALYAEGLWDDLALHMASALGPWGTCYLEAILRAADNTISQEGR